MSRDGIRQQVTHVFTKEANRLIGIKVAGLPEVVQCTPNHLVWAVKRASGTNDVTPSRRNLISALHVQAGFFLLWGAHHRARLCPKIWRRLGKGVVRSIWQLGKFSIHCLVI